MFAAGFGARRNPLLDRVLMRARKRRVDEFARVGMARVHGQAVAELRDLHDPIYVTQHESGIDALAVEVQREADDVDVAGALTVAEQRSLDAIGACHDREFCSGNGRAAVVVGVHGEHHAVAVTDLVSEPFDLVRVDVRCGHLHRCGQVQDDRRRRCRLPDVHHGFTDLHREVELGSRKALGRVLERDLGRRNAVAKF